MSLKDAEYTSNNLNCSSHRAVVLNLQIVGRRVLCGSRTYLVTATCIIKHSYRICACISRTRVFDASRFPDQVFGNNDSYISRTRFYLCESKIFANAFAVLWLSLAAFTVICQ
jgi:hypothetical protein